MKREAPRSTIAGSLESHRQRLLVALIVAFDSRDDPFRATQLPAPPEFPLCLPGAFGAVAVLVVCHNRYQAQINPFIGVFAVYALFRALGAGFPGGSAATGVHPRDSELLCKPRRRSSQGSSVGTQPILSRVWLLLYRL